MTADPLTSRPWLNPSTPAAARRVHRAAETTSLSMVVGVAPALSAL